MEHLSPQIDEGNSELTRATSSNIGILHVEGRIRPDLAITASQIFTSVEDIFLSDDLKDCHTWLWEDLLQNCAYAGLFPESLESLIITEYTGSDEHNGIFKFSETTVRLYIYYHKSDADDVIEDETLRFETILMPSKRFEGLWQRLIYDHDHRGDLLRMMQNMMQFSRALNQHGYQSLLNRLILLSGAPGSGKTSLCQALAYKLAIRLEEFEETKLMQINAAAMISRYHGQSGQNIFRLFKKIEEDCKDGPMTFICVLIDEVESLAACREMASRRGELQDAVRATNALLTGLDRVRNIPNLMILCTSNMAWTLDASFLDRCGAQILVEAPSLRTRYDILCSRIEHLTSARIINNESNLPTYRDAMDFLTTKRTGRLLISLCRTLSEASGHISSARFLGRLPEVALAVRLVAIPCNLIEALEHITEYTNEQIKNNNGSRPSVNLEPPCKQKKRVTNED